MDNYNYIDIHAHILPGVDDGPDNIEETIDMLKLSLEQGVKTIIATPHYIPGGENPSVDKLNKIKNQVQEEAYRLDSEFHIYLGNELLYSESIIDYLKSGKALTLADSRYVLVEFLTRITYENMYRGLNELLHAGYIPILAHVERYRCLYRKNKLIMELVALGCYIQMNSRSITGKKFNSKNAFNIKLINLGLVHFIGSDCHDDTKRLPDFNKTVDYLNRKCDFDVVSHLLIENPLSVLADICI
jgi:protein-tyrosine phosphatase